MIERFEILPREGLISIVVLTGRDIDGLEFAEQDNSYRIEISTGRRLLVIEGDHDNGPDLSESRV